MSSMTNGMISSISLWWSLWQFTGVMTNPKPISTGNSFLHGRGNPKAPPPPHWGWGTLAWMWVLRQQQASQSKTYKQATIHRRGSACTVENEHLLERKTYYVNRKTLSRFTNSNSKMENPKAGFWTQNGRFLLNIQIFDFCRVLTGCGFRLHFCGIRDTLHSNAHKKCISGPVIR